MTYLFVLYVALITCVVMFFAAVLVILVRQYPQRASRRPVSSSLRRTRDRHEARDQARH